MGRKRVRIRGRAVERNETQAKMLVVPYSQVFVGSKKLNKFDKMQVLGFETLMSEIASRKATSSVSTKSIVTKQNRIHKRRSRPRPNRKRKRRRQRIPRKPKSKRKSNKTLIEESSTAVPVKKKSKKIQKNTETKYSTQKKRKRE